MLETARTASAASPMAVEAPPAPGAAPLKRKPVVSLQKTVAAPPRPASGKAESPSNPPAVPADAPPLLPAGNWPPGAPAMVDPLRTIKLMQQWVTR